MSSATVEIDDVIRFLVAREADMREDAACMGCNMFQHDARVEANGVSKAIDAIRDEFGGTA